MIRRAIRSDNLAFAPAVGQALAIELFRETGCLSSSSRTAQQQFISTPCLLKDQVCLLSIKIRTKRELEIAVLMASLL
jgi:hypothetical protein